MIIQDAKKILPLNIQEIVEDFFLSKTLAKLSKERI